ncbi:MAG: hypothetical protein ACI8VZ_002170, partial [Candidatus Paceibacteria bacterium]
MKSIKATSFILLVCSLLIQCKTNAQEKWMLGFEKPAQNPIMQADSSFVFNCPMEEKLVQWQKADVFNPAAIVRNDTVFVLFRAEDNP